MYAKWELLYFKFVFIACFINLAVGLKSNHINTHEMLHVNEFINCYGWNIILFSLYMNFYGLRLKFIMIKFWIKYEKYIHFKSQFGEFCSYLFYSLWYHTYKLDFMFQNLTHILSIIWMEVEDTLNSIMTSCRRYFYMDKVGCPWKEPLFSVGLVLERQRDISEGFRDCQGMGRNSCLEYSHHHGLWSTFHELG